jgi:hypothetical protein
MGWGGVKSNQAGRQGSARDACKGMGLGGERLKLARNNARSRSRCLLRNSARQEELQ